MSPPPDLRAPETEPAPRPRRRAGSDWLRLPIRSLQSGLVLWNTAVVLLTVTVTMIAVREGLRIRLLQEADRELLDDAQAMRLAVSELYPNLTQLQQEFDRQALGHTHRELFFQLLNRNGQVRLSSQRTPKLDTLSIEAHPEGTLATSGRFRLAARGVEPREGESLVIRAGASLDPIYADVRRVSQIMFVVGLAFAVLAPLSGYWLARQATEPVGTIIDTARRLRPSQLDERLPIRGTGDELDRIAITVNALLDRIAAYLAQNREFVANAAHELRSPLAAIQSAVEVALNSDRSTEEYKELLNSLVEECASLTVLVNQLLFLAEADASIRPPGRQVVALDQLLANAGEMFRGIAEEREIALEVAYSARPRVPGDAHRLRQVINNLLDNALKFTPSGGNVRVELDQSPGEAGWAVLRVSDSGPGIAAGDLPHVFERFFRGDKSRHRDGSVAGTGLGLSICQAIVMAHQGTITVASQPEQGATFTVELPLASSSLVETTPAARPAGLGNSGRQARTPPAGSPDGRAASTEDQGSPRPPVAASLARD